MANSNRFRTPTLAIFSLLGAILLFAAVVYFMRAHVRAARSIKPGYSSYAVHQVLGEPTAVIKSIGELNEMFPPTTSYRFTTLDGQSIQTDTIDFYVADWFEHGSAGYLVLYEDGVVARTIWGGT